MQNLQVEVGLERGLGPSDIGLAANTSGYSGPYPEGGRSEMKLSDCVAAREGLEPPTLALGKLCSIRLSYRATRGA